MKIMLAVVCLIFATSAFGATDADRRLEQIAADAPDNSEVTNDGVDSNEADTIDCTDEDCTDEQQDDYNNG